MSQQTPVKKKKRKAPSVRETEKFQELVKDLHRQVPDDKKQLQEMLDEIITDKAGGTET